MNPADAPFGAIATILAMALTTHLIRFGGYWMMGHVPLTPRIRRMLDALPGSVVAATILPIVAKSGAPAVLGIVAVVAVMAWRRNDFLAVAVGIGLVALARAGGF